MYRIAALIAGLIVGGALGLAALAWYFTEPDDEEY